MMIAARFASLVQVYALLAGLSYGALAQVAAPLQGSGDAGTPNPAASQFSVNTQVGDWAVRCALTTVKSPTPCEVIQQVLNDDTKAQVMSFSLAYLPSRDNYSMQVIVPTGVALQRGLIVAAGAVALQGVKFTRCERNGCYVEALIDAAAVNALFAAGASTRVTMIGYGQTNEINLPLSLEGFSVALDEMRKLARVRAIPIPVDQPLPQPLTVTAYAPSAPAPAPAANAAAPAAQ